MLNLCDPNITGIADIIVTDSTSGIQMGNLVNSSTNTSLFYKTFISTPPTNQIERQQVCMIAYTDVSTFLFHSSYC